MFQDPSWDFHTFDFTTDVAFADEGVGTIVNSIDPDLTPFRSHGGKMIHYVGWADSAIAPMNSVIYYDEVRKAVHGRDIHEFYRLFMVPGMAHCGGGDGPNAFGNGTATPPVIDAEHDLLTALDRWVEDGVAPDEIIATHYVNNSPAAGVAFQRPLCPYPEIAWFLGGNPSIAADFRCVRDEPDRDPRAQDLHGH